MQRCHCASGLSCYHLPIHTISSYMEILHISYNMGKSGLPDIYTRSPWASGVYIRQTTHAHGITETYM